MKKLFTISLLLFIIGCAGMEMLTDYTGAKVDAYEHPFVIVSYEQSRVNEDIYYLKTTVNMFKKPLESTKTMRHQITADEELLLFAHHKGYMAYNVIEVFRESGVFRMYDIIKIHLHKTEEDFDKWNTRYKD